MEDNIYKITINSKNYGDLNGTNIYLTNDLYTSLEKSKTKDGTPVLKLLELGRAIQGLKHLIAIINANNKQSRLILSKTATKKENSDYYINYDDYRDRSKARFFSLYRETGLDAARSYLNSYFPNEFTYDSKKLTESELKKINRSVPEVLDSISNNEKNKVIIIEEATKTIAKLRHRTKKLNSALEDLRNQNNLIYYQETLEVLRQRLTQDFHETRGKESWQHWIYENNWLFGVYYMSPPIEKYRVGFRSIPDYLFATLDGFIDILEIKKPSFDVIQEDSSHPGSFAWCPETNKAIGQVVNYIQQMELHQLELTNLINEKYGLQYEMHINILRPRAFVLVGNSDNWPDTKIKALRMLNYSLHGVEVLTYSDLISRGKSIILMLSRK